MPLVLSQAEFEAALRRIGAERYHDKHPFHRAMEAGALAPHELRAWAANRYYYQKNIPVKDAAILSHLPDRTFRRRWVQRIIDHDGTCEGEGGLDMWLVLARALGLSDEVVMGETLVHPGTKAAVDAYVAFARAAHWLPAVASSLTELFAPDLMSRRMAALTEKYSWIDPAGLAYFRQRLRIAPEDARYTLEWVLHYANSAEQQQACLEALRFKCGVLWQILDATQSACVRAPA
jgi:pyrroloquinoline-quinone synthase